MENSIPDTILTKLFDSTGTNQGDTKGFILLYVNDVGSPTIISKSDNMCVSLALRKAAEIFVESEQNYPSIQ